MPAGNAAPFTPKWSDGYYPDGHESGAVRAAIVSGDLVRTPIRPGNYWSQTNGSATATYQANGVTDNADGTATGINISVPAGINNGVLLTFPFWGRRVGVRARRGSASADYQIKVDGTPYAAAGYQHPALMLRGMSLSSLTDGDGIGAIVEDLPTEGPHYLEIEVVADNTVVVNGAGALISATSVPVAALENAYASGTVITFASAKTATLSAAAKVGDTTISVTALAAALSAGDAGGASRSVLLFGLLLERRAGYQEQPRVGQLLTPVTLTTSQVAVPGTPTTATGLRTIRKIVYANTTAGAITVTVQSNAVTIWSRSIAANSTEELDFGIPVGYTSLITHAASAGSSVNATVVGVSECRADSSPATRTATM